MRKAPASTIFAASSILAGLAILTPTSHVSHAHYRLIDEALIIDPINNSEWNEAATSLYLDPQGFSGTVSTLTIPEYIHGDSLAQAVGAGAQDLVNAVEAQYNANDISSSDPLYIFGYSQSAVDASMAEQQLADDGIPSSDLHFVLVGDSASADGGFLNTFISSLPAWLQQYETEALLHAGIGDVLGATTPDNLYPTDVYTLSGDGWANWDDGANILGMVSTHLEYLGLTPAEVSTATVSAVDDMTTYLTINSAGVNGLEALWDGLMIAASGL
jgi:PE-PPE domain